MTKMCEVVEVKQSISVKWETGRPFADVPRQSSEFSFMGSRWYLRSAGYLKYNITLNKITDDKLLSGNFESWTFVTGWNSTSCFPSVWICSPGECVSIWSCDELTAKNYQSAGAQYGKWTVYCIFRSDQPTGLPMNKNETIDLSTQTDFDWPMSAADEASSPEGSKSDLESLSFDLGNLLEQKSSPDVMLRCGSHMFSAHRSILSARSEVFAAMFRNKWVESQTITVNIAGVEGEVLDMLLKYVYSGKIADLSDDDASSLYTAADKYSIPALKEGCSNWIVRSLTKENCLDCLLLADASSDESFRDRVVAFVARILESLEEKSWSTFDNDHPVLASRVYRRRYAARPKPGANP